MRSSWPRIQASKRLLHEDDGVQATSGRIMISMHTHASNLTKFILGGIPFCKKKQKDYNSQVVKSVKRFCSYQKLSCITNMLNIHNITTLLCSLSSLPSKKPCTFVVEVGLLGYGIYSSANLHCWQFKKSELWVTCVGYNLYLSWAQPLTFIPRMAYKASSPSGICKLYPIPIYSTKMQYQWYNAVLLFQRLHHTNFVWGQQEYICDSLLLCTVVSSSVNLCKQHAQTVWFWYRWCLPSKGCWICCDIVLCTHW